MIPTSLTLTYRLDIFADRYGIPLAPYGRVALRALQLVDQRRRTGRPAQTGATNGWSVAGGLALMLDFFDPGLARELDQDTGINHTYLFFERPQDLRRRLRVEHELGPVRLRRAHLTAGLLFVF